MRIDDRFSYDETRRASQDEASHLISNFETFNSSAFEIYMFGEDMYRGENNSAIDFKYPLAPFRASTITFPSLPQLRFKNRNWLFKESYIEGIELSNSLEITWLEDLYMSVFNYHRAWYDSWYDRTRDCYKQGPHGKKRNALIIITTPFDKDDMGLLKPITVKDDSGEWNTHNIQKVLHYFALEGIAPVAGFQNMTLDWGKSNELKTYTASYIVDRVIYGFNYEVAPKNIGFGKGRVNIEPNRPNSIMMATKSHSSGDSDIREALDRSRTGNDNSSNRFLM